MRAKEPNQRPKKVGANIGCTSQSMIALSTGVSSSGWGADLIGAPRVQATNPSPHIILFRCTPRYRARPEVEGHPAMAALSADVDRLHRRLASDGHRMELPSSIATDLSRVTRALHRLQGMLATAEKHPFEARREHCLSKIKRNIYEVEDILDELEDGRIRPQGSSRGWKLDEASDLWSQVAFFFLSNHSVLHCRMVRKMKKIRKSLDHASEDSFIFSLLQHKHDADQSCDENVFDETAIIGRERDKENLRALLLNTSEQKSSIIPIVGLGGLGKTALAQLIFRDPDDRYNFDLRIWINLNMSYDLNRIASSIISKANRTEKGTSQVDEEGEENAQIIMNCLQEVLRDKRCLIVLDGLWSTDEGQLLHLKRMLLGTQNTKIIVTTCSENVAELMHTVRPYKLGPLSEENCWTIFSQTVFGNGGNTDLIRIGKQIVKKCQGIPAAIHSLGSFVRDKGTSDWNDEKQELWKLERQFPFHINMFSSIKQIYYNMPSAMRSCFSYLSMFPKGSDIRSENLIRQWAALGILGTTHGSLPVYAQGKKYIQELLSIFFLEASDSKSSGSTLSHACASKVFNMHNLVHEFARYITSHDVFMLDGEKTHNDSPENCTPRYVLLTRCSDISKTCKGFLTSVRAICLKDCGGAKLIEKIFSALKHLRVLDLSRCSFLELPSSICQLTHLRYIDISSSAIQSLPVQMSLLQNLEALDLSGTCIQVLPDFGTFQKLKYLNLQGCRELHHLPSKLDDIHSLQHLNLSCCPAAPQILKSISGFQELRFLDISSCTELQRLPESFGGLKNLVDLIMSKCTRLKKLPESFGELCFLQFLNVSNCWELEDVPASIGKLACLEVLILSGCSRIRNLPQSFSNIAFLRILDLAGCVDLHMNLGMLPNSNLEYLNVDRCRKVCAVPGWTVNFPKLHPECLETCEQHIQCLTTGKQVCPSYNEVEISSELNLHVHDETGEARGSQSCQQAVKYDYTTQKVTEDSYVCTTADEIQKCDIPTGGHHKSHGSFLRSSRIKFSKMSHFMCMADMKRNTGRQGEEESNMKIFSYKELQKATHNFSLANKIGEGSFGSLFRGSLKDGMCVAIKVLTYGSRMGLREFLTEFTSISDIKHANLIDIVGCCAEWSHRILVYNYLENSSLADKLLGSGRSSTPINWRARVKIALGVAHGLAYLHEEVRPPLILQNIKASNILLDKDFSPKISDFGLSRLALPTHVTTQVAVTAGYLAPEYVILGQVTKKSDIYSFGILLLEIVGGRCNYNPTLPPEDQSLLEKAATYYEQGNLEEIIDSELGEDLDVEEACRFLKVGLLCAQDMVARRPNMSKILKMLTGDNRVSMDGVTKPVIMSEMRTREKKKRKEIL